MWGLIPLSMKWTEKMVQSERMEIFLRSMEGRDLPWLEDMEETARSEYIPIIRPETKSFLRVLIQMTSPGSILEIGTAIGYSALVMAQQSGPETRIVTIEQDKDRISRAKENFARFYREGKIRLLEGDASSILAGMQGEYDLVFMDAAKGQYLNFLPDVLRLTRCGGVVVSDNVLQEGSLLDSHYALERRKRTIYHRMREYLYVLKHTPGLLTSVIPLGDGVSITIKQYDIPAEKLKERE